MFRFRLRTSRNFRRLESVCRENEIRFRRLITNGNIDEPARRRRGKVSEKSDRRVFFRHDGGPDETRRVSAIFEVSSLESTRVLFRQFFLPANDTRTDVDHGRRE